MTVTCHVTRDKRRDSRQTFGRYTEPILRNYYFKYSTSSRAAVEHLARILNGAFGTIDQAAGL